MKSIYIGLPPPPPTMPNWTSMDYDQFAAYFHSIDLGTFDIPLTNVNVHTQQRTLDEPWVSDLQLKKFADGIQPNAHPGVAILNTETLPLDPDGKTDSSQIKASIISAVHWSTARLRMDGPDEKKTWVFRVYPYST